MNGPRGLPLAFAEMLAAAARDSGLVEAADEIQAEIDAWHASSPEGRAALALSALAHREFCDHCQAHARDAIAALQGTPLSELTTKDS